MKCSIIRTVGLWFATIFASLALLGCTTVQLKSTNLTLSDFVSVADEMSRDLLSSGKLDVLVDKFPDGKPVIFVSRVVNATSSPLPQSALVDSLVDAIQKTDQIDAMPDDAKTMELWAFNHPDESFETQLTLSGRISSSTTYVGKAETKEYLIRMEINCDGRVIWRSTKTVIKKDRD